MAELNRGGYAQSAFSSILERVGENQKTFFSSLLENAMLARREPLIDIALASFAARRETLAELWKRATTGGYQNDIVSKAIRLGCLSNRAADKWKFPSDFIGKDETQRLFATADYDETEALLGNERIDDDLLVALFEKEEPFTAISEERWKDFISRT